MSQQMSHYHYSFWSSCKINMFHCASYKNKEKTCWYYVYFIKECIGSGFDMLYFLIFRAGPLRWEIRWFYSTLNAVHYRGKTLIPFSSNICICSFIQAILLQYTDWICITDYYLWEKKNRPRSFLSTKDSTFKIF